MFNQPSGPMVVLVQALLFVMALLAGRWVLKQPLQRLLIALAELQRRIGPGTAPITSLLRSLWPQSPKPWPSSCNAVAWMALAVARG